MASPLLLQLQVQDGECTTTSASTAKQAHTVLHCACESMLFQNQEAVAHMLPGGIGHDSSWPESLFR